jgi:hypothetical protein
MPNLRFLDLLKYFGELVFSPTTIASDMRAKKEKDCRKLSKMEDRRARVYGEHWLPF